MGPPGAAALPAPRLRVPPRAGKGEGNGRLEAGLKSLSRPPGHPPRPPAGARQSTPAREEGARARTPPAGRRGWGRASRHRPSSPRARARLAPTPGGRDGRVLPRCARRPTSASALRPPLPAAAARRTHLRAARSALAGCWLGAAPPPPRPSGRPASHPGPRAPPIRRRSPGAGTLPPADWRPRPPVRARGTPAERSARRVRKNGGGKEGGRAPGKGRGASGAQRVAGHYLPTSFPFGRPALPAGPAARAANQRTGCSGCEPRVGGLESEGRRRSLIGPASPVEPPLGGACRGPPGPPSVVKPGVDTCSSPGKPRGRDEPRAEEVSAEARTPEPLPKY
nr:uncharacterized protein LOC115859199 [Globicephala melas]